MQIPSDKMVSVFWFRGALAPRNAYLGAECYGALALRPLADVDPGMKARRNNCFHFVYYLSVGT
jgi:hypothetical protein